MAPPRPASVLVLLALAFAGCTGGQTGDEGAVGRGAGGTMGGSGMGGSGAMTPGGGTPGPECTTDAHCRARIEDDIGVLSKPRDERPRQLLRARCVAGVDTCPGPTHCECDFYVEGREDVAVLTLGTGYYRSTGDFDGCDVRSRAFGCIGATDAFAGCDAAKKGSCNAACQAALDAVAADAARTFDVDVRHATCVEQSCRIVVRVDDRCYTPSEGSVLGYDCALSDDSIIEMAYPPIAPEPDAGAPRCRDGDAGARVCELTSVGEPVRAPGCEASPACDWVSCYIDAGTMPCTGSRCRDGGAP